MPVAEFEENSLRFAEDHKSLHKTFQSQKPTFLGNFSSWLTRHSLKRSYKRKQRRCGRIVQRWRKHRLFLVAEF